MRDRPLAAELVKAPAYCQSQGFMKKVLIGGIGNVLLGDDGVGPYGARLLAARYEFDDGVEVADLGTPALDLIDQISGKDAVILIDSIIKLNSVSGGQTKRSLH